MSPASPALQADSLPTEPPGKSQSNGKNCSNVRLCHDGSSERTRVAGAALIATLDTLTLFLCLLNIHLNWAGELCIHKIFLIEFKFLFYFILEYS